MEAQGISDGFRPYINNGYIKPVKVFNSKHLKNLINSFEIILKKPKESKEISSKLTIKQYGG